MSEQHQERRREIDVTHVSSSTKECVGVERPTIKALDVQVGGQHYKDMAIQPFEYIHANGIGFAEGCAIKYLSRWRAKGGVEDLKKARHFIDLLIEAESKGKS